MAARQYSFTPGPNEKTGIIDTGTLTAISGGATSLGGTVGARLLIDDAVMTSKAEVMRALALVRQRIMERDWPPA